jgi:DNA-binding MarR family transcriptional regulator
MSVESPGAARTGQDALASEAWVAMLQFFFTYGRPRMLELWREFDLMPPQQMVLGLLDEPRPMGELAQEMHCDNSNITGIVDRLAERGLVERRAAEGDRRIKLVALTQAGEELRAELNRRRAEPPPELTKLPATELEELRRIFSAIAE